MCSTTNQKKSSTRKRKKETKDTFGSDQKDLEISEKQSRKNLHNSEQENYKPIKRKMNRTIISVFSTNAEALFTEIWKYIMSI